MGEDVPHVYRLLSLAETLVMGSETIQRNGLFEENKARQLIVITGTIVLVVFL